MIDHILGKVDRGVPLSLDRECNLAEIVGLRGFAGVGAHGLKRMVDGTGGLFRWHGTAQRDALLHSQLSDGASDLETASSAGGHRQRRRRLVGLLPSPTR